MRVDEAGDGFSADRTPVSATERGVVKFGTTFIKR
jgi:hypothetical protein